MPAAHSGASSIKSTPWWASEHAPGRILCEPPPTIDTRVALWCGATIGGMRDMGERCERVPATE